MPKPYHSFHKRAGSALKWGLSAISIAIVVSVWPNPRRQIERQIVGMADAVSHHGTIVDRDWLAGLSRNIHENCSNGSTAVTIEGHVNEALSQEKIIEGVAQIAADSTEFIVKFEHITVDLLGESKRAQVSADAIVEWTREHRAERERRHVIFSLQQDDRRYRVIAIEASANIVNQPEPRP